jgi:protein involved in polysaccharide export with SLBB domain
MQKNDLCLDGGCTSSRGFRSTVARRQFLPLAFPMLLLTAGSVLAQTIAPDALEEAARRTGVSKDEIIRRYQQVEPRTPDSPVPGAPATPGRQALPDASPEAVLPSATGEAIPAVVATPAAKGPDQAGAGGLFGSSFFKLQAGVFTQNTFGPVPEDYVIGVGDQVVVDVWGDVEFRLERVVDRDGTIILPKGGRVLCSGRSLTQLRAAVRERLSQSYSGLANDTGDGTTFLDVSLGKLRAIRVFVIGEATQPGAYELSSISTIFTALYAAGGPSSNGSMRDIRLMRGNQALASLDIYEYLLRGDRSNDLMLKEYDTVLIPPRGKTVALAGSVRRPMRYELREGEDLLDLLRFGAGFTATAATEILHLVRVLPPQERLPGLPDRMQIDIPMDAGTGRPLDPRHAMLLDADAISVGAVSDRLENWVEIQGAVKRPGHYQYAEHMDVVALLDMAGQTWPDLMEQRAALDRVAPDGTFQSYDLPLGDILAGRAEKVLLQPRDAIRVYSKWDLQDRFPVAISGEVRSPGNFPYREGLTLRELVLKAGGLRESVDSLRVEISRPRSQAMESRDLTASPAKTVDVIVVPLGQDFLTAQTSFPLEPHDQVMIRRMPWWELQRTVVLTGDVLYPGEYVLEGPGMTLSDLIARAEGLKPTAYVEGARLTRGRDGIGNVAIDLACALRDPHSWCDLTVFEGDQIIIPPTPHTVTVIGAVGYTTSLPYRPGRRPGYYIGRAGGYADGADKRRTSVIYPNGFSRPVRKLWWDPKVLAGSTISVGYKAPVEKSEWLATVEKVTSIIAATTTAIFLADRATR